MVEDVKSGPKNATMFGLCIGRDQTEERKVLLVGASMSGKSTFAHNIFYDRKRRGRPRCTIGVDVMSVDLTGDGGKIRVNIWDCAGNPRYMGMGSEYWKGATHAIIFGTRDNADHKWLHKSLPNSVKRIEILDYDQDNEDFVERKEWLYNKIYD